MVRARAILAERRGKYEEDSEQGPHPGQSLDCAPILALAVLLSIVVAWCMEPPAENAELMYVFVDNDDQVHIIDREHQIAYETESLQFHTDTSAADLQILLRKKENVTITKDGETFTAAARETVENLLRRMDLEPDAGEMVALSVQDDGVHVDIVRDFYHDWNTEAVVPLRDGAPREPLLAKGIRSGSCRRAATPW